jgi:hypothetical protein
LHFDDEGTPLQVFALQIEDGVFEQARQVRHLFGGQVFKAFDLPILRQGQQRIQKTSQQMRMLTKHTFESDVYSGVKVAGGHGGVSAVAVKKGLV